MDNMITKFKSPVEHVVYLEEIFKLLRKYHIKLNLERCVFKVSLGKLLRFLISHRGIEANLKKIRAIIEMKSPHTMKEIQSLIEKSAVMNRFISKAKDK